MSRSGPLGKKQCLERSLRSDPPRRRHSAFSRPDFLYPQGCALLDLVQPGFVAEPARPEFHWAVWRDHRRVLLHDDGSGFVPARGRPPRIRGREIVSVESAADSTPRLDRPLHYLGSVPAPIANPAPAGLEIVLQYPGTWRMAGLLHWQEAAPHLDGRSRIDHSPRGRLCHQPHPDDGAAPDPRDAADRGCNPERDGRVTRMATEAPASEIGFEGAAGDQSAGIGEAAASDRKAVEEKGRARGRTGSRGSHYAGGIVEPAEAESGRHHRAADGAGKEETVARRIAWLGEKGESAGWPDEQNLG